MIELHAKFMKRRENEGIDRETYAKSVCHVAATVSDEVDKSDTFGNTLCATSILL